MLNSCILTGNLGADPEIFYSSEGDPVATFNLAFRSSKKKTGWIKITCFQRLAETAERYLHKGARIAVIGYLDQQKWETDVACLEELADFDDVITDPPSKDEVARISIYHFFDILHFPVIISVKGLPFLQVKGSSNQL